MKLLLAMLVALALGGPAVALVVGDQIGPVRMNSGGVICDTEAQARQAIDQLDRNELRLPDGCGTITGWPWALLKAIGTHESSRATYMILKAKFLPPAALGVQYGWTLIQHEKAAPEHSVRTSTPAK